VSKKVIYEKKGEVAYVTLNRPEKRNAIDVEMHERLREVWIDFRDDAKLRVAILTGAGDIAFCAGADLASHALNGVVFGGGLELALACDIRVASERAQFGSFHIRRGMHAADGGIVRLVNTCGTGIALEMELTGEPIDAARALQVNLVSRVVPHGELMSATQALVEKILRNPRRGVESAKETILSVSGRPLDEQLRLEALLGYSLMDDPAIRERAQRFLEQGDGDRSKKDLTRAPG
jgi:enoyl-CoA hydratase/carnithine racemase